MIEETVSSDPMMVPVKTAGEVPGIPGKTWIRAYDRYPESGQRVLYWFEIIGGPFDGHYEYSEEMEGEHLAHYHCFYGKNGWLTNDDVWYIPLAEDEPIPPFRKNRDRIDPADWEFMEDKE